MIKGRDMVMIGLQVEEDITLIEERRELAEYGS